MNIIPLKTGKCSKHDLFYIFNELMKFARQKHSYPMYKPSRCSSSRTNDQKYPNIISNIAHFEILDSEGFPLIPYEIIPRCVRLWSNVFFPKQVNETVDSESAILYEDYLHFSISPDLWQKNCLCFRLWCHGWVQLLYLVWSLSRSD